MSFDARESARVHQPAEGDTLEAIAARESQAGNPLTADDLARFNCGTTDEIEVQAFLRDELGARRRDARNRFALSPDDQPRRALLIPQRFQRAGLPVMQTHTLRVARRDAPPQYIDCCHLPGITFEFDSSFIRPGVRGYLRKLELLAQRHPQAKIMIFGHTDRVGDELYNKKLSERRAWSVHAFITNAADDWESLYNREKWGLDRLRQIQAALGRPPGDPPPTDAAGRRRLFADYMAGEADIDIAPERFMAPGYMGCGEFNPIEDADAASEQNRRVTFFLFHPERLPNLPCQFADLAPCRRQMASGGAGAGGAPPRHRATFRCSFFDSLSRQCGSKPEPPRPDVRLRSRCLRDSQWLHDVLNERRVVQEGTNAPDGIRRLQAGLLWLEQVRGLPTTGVRMLDGQYGQAMVAAVKRFQTNEQLAADGVVSAGTLKAMDDLLVRMEQDQPARTIAWEQDDG